MPSNSPIPTIIFALLYALASSRISYGINQFKVAVKIAIYKFVNWIGKLSLPGKQSYQIRMQQLFSSFQKK